MYLLINSQQDGQRLKSFATPFKGSHIISYRDDNMTYTYAYDDIEEFMRKLSREQDGTTDSVIFKLDSDDYKKASKILDIAFIYDGEGYENFEGYEDYFIAGFNGLPDWITVKDYMKEMEAVNA